MKMKKLGNNGPSTFKCTAALLVLVAALLFAGCSNGDDGPKGDPGNLESFLEMGLRALEAGNYDVAISCFDSAYALNSNNPEAIVYSTLGRLAAIAVDNNVRALMRDRLGITGYPGTVNKLVSPDWMEAYVTYEWFWGEYAWVETSFRPGLAVPSWIANTNEYKGTLTTQQLKSSATFELLMFANLIDKNTNGLNALLDQVLSTAFGTAFEAAYTRAGTLNGSVKLNESTLEAFGISDIFEGEAVYIGKAELKLLFATLRFVKASVEWVAAYDWNTDLNFLKNGPLWDDWSKLGTNKPANLPLRNNFLKDRGNGMMANSKADFSKAIDDAIAAYDLWIGAASKLPAGYKDTLNEYAWAKDGFNKLKTAINNGGTFYVKEASGNTYDNSASGAELGIDMSKLFKPGQLAINGLIENTGGSKPKFYGYDEETDSLVEITQKAQLSNYGFIGFQFNLQPIKQIVVLGFEDMPDDFAVPIFTPDFAGYIWDWYN